MGTEALVVVAHQGGWDEAFLVAIPMAVLAGLLWLAKRRAEAEGRAGGSEAEAEGDAGEDQRRPFVGSEGPPAPADG
ncbi:MAG: hypothetical protein ACR2G7_07525 [Acidimicrobiales bacterium]